MHLLGLGFLLLFLGLTPASAVTSPAEIASPRPAGWITDQANILKPDTVAELNRLLDEVHRRDGAEMAIVTVDTLNGANPRRFATELFNRWRIGDPARNNGLLLFIALRGRKAEIILGRGIESAAHVARSDRIMQDIIVPRFRSGDSAGGLAAGARACAVQFFGVAAAPRAVPTSADTLVEEANAPPSVTAAPAATLERPATATRPTEAPPRAARPVPDFARPPVILTIIAMILGGVGFFGGLFWMLRRSTAPRHCAQCRTPMTKLDEAQDDARLSPTERAEEKVGSVNYDVWLCPTCTGILKVRHGRWFTKYCSCPHCGAKTHSSVSRTLNAATTVTTGLLEVHEFCACCNHTRVTTRVLPRLVAPSSSARSSGFGGGSSSGRGSSGSW